MTKPYIEMTDAEQREYEKERLIYGNAAPPDDKETKDMRKVLGSDYKTSEAQS